MFISIMARINILRGDEHMISFFFFSFGTENTHVEDDSSLSFSYSYAGEIVTIPGSFREVRKKL